jgi:UDP-N-acetylmuramoyl-L-alanyl-D-glutamate--2,6-diaminopimelate ligase
MEAYAAAKARIFRLLKPGGTAVVHADDAHAARMAAAAAETGARVVTFGTGSRVDLCVSRTSAGREGISISLTGMGIQREGLVLPLVGRHNVENATAAIAAVLLMGASPSRVLEGLATVSAPPGRLEPVDTGARGFGCYVDYAHTPDALERALAAVRPLVSAAGRLIVVFGCGGDRDPGKRAPMGAAAARAADVAVITSDNPRSEDPAAITAEVERGAREEEGRASIEVVVERRVAIRRALEVARAGDVVLIAGKGHEAWQVSGGKKLPFDDRLVAAEELRA